jgi:hypothetical protein
MSWVKLNGDAWLSHDLSPASLPNDFWAQVDVWIPPTTFTACFDGDLFGFTADFLDFGNDSLQAKRIQPGPWTWATEYGVVAASGPSPSTTYTLKAHYAAGPSIAGVDWFVNGVLVANDPNVFKFSEHLIFLNHFPEGCCCEIYYYSNVKVGTSDGGTDIFAEDFSGGLGNWTRNQIFMPSAVALVAAPAAAACPTLTLNPPRGMPGDSFIVTVTGLAPNRPLTLFFDNHQLPITESSDGSGNATFTATVPHLFATGTGEGYSVYVLDDEANIACSESFEPGGGFDICGPTLSDGISTAVDPLVATGGTTDFNNKILDYIFHDGAHWVLWQDESAITNTGTFPPPANHTLNATRIAADGSSAVDYPIDTNYRWNFGRGNVGDPGLSGGSCGSPRSAPVWDAYWFFESWDKPIYDAHFASDGTNLWVALLTQETVVYPWLDNLDAVGLNPGSAAQFVPLATLTAGFTSFPTSAGAGFHRYNTQTTGPINFYQPHSFPVTDSGDNDTGHWSIFVVAVFAFTGSGFNRIGDIQAKYAPGGTTGYGYAREGSIIGSAAGIQSSPRGLLASRVSVCASPNDPGRMHLVWSEGGDWGRVGLGNPVDCSALLWDQGPQNRSYRVNYTTWSPTGKLTDVELWESHQDRTNWFFLNDYQQGGGDFEVGYTWPLQANFAGLLQHDLRNDNADGTPYLFAVWPVSVPDSWIPESSNDGNVGFPPAYTDPHGHVFLDNILLFGDTLHVYDLSSGGAVEVQTLDLSTLGTSVAEFNQLYTVTAPWENPVGPADSIIANTDVFGGCFGGQNCNLAVEDKVFALSLPYDDPELGVPVYLVSILEGPRWVPEASDGALQFNLGGQFQSRNFYRVPCDMSAPFEYLDGDRLVGFTVIKDAPVFGILYAMGSADFFSDRKNIWVPSPPDGGVGFGFNGYQGFYFDRVCLNQWLELTGNPPLTPYPGGGTFFTAGAQCSGFYYDPDSETISLVTASDPAGNSVNGGPLFAVVTLPICRGCNGCKCATGVHLAHRF